MVVADGLVSFVGCAGVIDFGDGGAEGARNFMIVVDGGVMNSVLSVENYGDDVDLPQAEINVEIIAGFGKQFRFDDFGVVVAGVAVVVLEGDEGLAKGDSRDEDDADPFVNEAAGNGSAGGHAALVVALDENLAVREIGVGLILLRGREGVDIEEVLFRGEVASVAGFFGAYVAVEGLRRFGSELRGDGWPGREGGDGEQGCNQGNGLPGLAWHVFSRFHAGRMAEEREGGNAREVVFVS